MVTAFFHLWSLLRARIPSGLFRDSGGGVHRLWGQYPV